MKIARCTRGGSPAWAVVDSEQGAVRPIVGSIAEWAPRLTAGEGERALAFTGERWRLDETTLLAPVERGSTVYVAGANYKKHLKEFRLEEPPKPFAFLKPYRALTAPYADLPYPALTNKLDFEVELVAVVGAPLKSGTDPLRSVLGYTIGNDISARDLQPGPGGAIGMDFLSAKGLDHMTPVGPWIVTRDEFGDVSPDLRLTLRVNDETRQDGRTSEMTWHAGELLAYVNSRSILEPGDILFTGTPAGVAQGDGRFLQPGNVVETCIERIGALRNVIAPTPR